MDDLFQSLASAGHMAQARPRQPLGGSDADGAAFGAAFHGALAANARKETTGGPTVLPARVPPGLGEPAPDQIKPQVMAFGMPDPASTAASNTLPDGTIGKAGHTSDGPLGLPDVADGTEGTEGKANPDAAHLRLDAVAEADASMGLAQTTTPPTEGRAKRPDAPVDQPLVMPVTLQKSGNSALADISERLRRQDGADILPAPKRGTGDGPALLPSVRDMPLPRDIRHGTAAAGQPHAAVPTPLQGSVIAAAGKNGGHGPMPQLPSGALPRPLTVPISAQTSLEKQPSVSPELSRAPQTATSQQMLIATPPKAAVPLAEARAFSMPGQMNTAVAPIPVEPQVTAQQINPQAARVAGQDASPRVAPLIAGQPLRTGGWTIPATGTQVPAMAAPVALSFASANTPSPADLVSGSAGGPDLGLGQTAPPGPSGMAATPSLIGHPPPQMAHSAAQQIAAALANPARDTGAPLELALDPPELGRVRLQITELAGVMTLTIHAERPETADLMRRHLDLLAQEFAQSGLDAPSVRISQDGAGGGGAQSHGRDDGALSAAPLPEADATPQPHSRTADGGLDLRL